MHEAACAHAAPVPLTACSATAAQAALIESTRTHINCVAEQNKVLALKAEMAEQLQDTVSKLGALNAAYQERLEDANARLAEQGASISNACATIKVRQGATAAAAAVSLEPPACGKQRSGHNCVCHWRARMGGDSRRFL